MALVIGGGITIGGGVSVVEEAGGPAPAVVHWTDADFAVVSYSSVISTLELGFLSSSSTGSALDLYNAVIGGTWVAGTPFSMVQSTGSNYIELVLTSGFTFDPGAGGGLGAYVAGATVTLGTSNGSTGIALDFPPTPP